MRSCLSFARPLTSGFSRRRALAAVAAFSLAAGAGCGDSPTGGATSGRITVLLTDAPGDVKKAVVTIAQVYLQGGEGENDSRVVLTETPVTTDLLTLADWTQALVKDATIPAGTYAQLRFVITGGYIEVENADGSTSIHASSPTYAGLPSGATVAGALQMPSFAQSGLKVTLPSGGVAIDGQQTVVVVDFDVSQSFGKAAGSSGQWVMQPSIKAATFGSMGSLRVTLSKDAGLVLPNINNAAITLGQFKAVLSAAGGSTKELALTDANSDGVFEADFSDVLAGAYSLDLRAPSDSVQFATTPGRPIAVQVGSTAATQAVVLATATK